ncbi:unnamed protein product [Bursaphelenchus okinawaensis]|uniref:G_PROTEIN_RECEP_F1_2 domain-containing protein n=1 Tax=Bursaphelenchus okinawaensis TaxID=465554 RepID=A0A811KBN7_9BILA|nr:unnamed protein product [Bursaphelenchus okinawaensis]CAG9099558.1 unnamed protein product [Bursaphelenchus okinawaensis]
MPLEKRRNIGFGMLIGLISFVFTVLYIFCFYALTRKELREKSCYKIMIMLGVYDMITLPLTGMFAAYQAISGITFCDSPLLQYCIGMVVLAAWIGYSWGTIILALNRVLFTTRAREYFDGRFIYLWLAVPPMITFLSMWYLNPAMFIPMYGGYLFNPYAGLLEIGDDTWYDNPKHTASDFVFMAVLPMIYAYFYFKNKYFLSKGGAVSSTGNSKREKSLFIQCVLISTLVCAATAGCTFMQIVPMPHWCIALSHFLWILVQGK